MTHILTPRAQYIYDNLINNEDWNIRTISPDMMRLTLKKDIKHQFIKEISISCDYYIIMYNFCEIGIITHQNRVSYDNETGIGYDVLPIYSDLDELKKKLSEIKQFMS